MQGQQPRGPAAAGRAKVSCTPNFLSVLLAKHVFSAMAVRAGDNDGFEDGADVDDGVFKVSPPSVRQIQDSDAFFLAKLALVSFAGDSPNPVCAPFYAATVYIT